MTSRQHSMQPTSDLRAGDVEITWSRLLAAMDEAAATMIRTAYSPTIRESKDLAVVYFDREARALAESTVASPSFLGTLPRTLAACLDVYSREAWSQGDLVITNDPWIGSGHLHDICMVAPVFVDETLIGFSAISAHGPDIGGSLYSALTREVYEEGICIPICRYAEGGRRNPVVEQFIRANVRVPDRVIGDIEGMAACLTVAAKQISDLAREVGPERFSTITDAILRRSEESVRTVLQDSPEGRFTARLTSDGFDVPLEIACSIEIRDRKISVDLSGSALSQPLGINVPFCYAYAHTIYPLKCVLAPATPNNHGTLAAFRVNAPVGSLFNPERPAPVNARHLSGQYLSAAVMLALAKWRPDLIIAESAVPRPQVVFSGVNGSGRPFVEHVFLASGMGASASMDGHNALSFPTNTSSTPIEIIENLTPLRVLTKELREGSAGSGRRRGGLGQRFVVQNTSSESLRVSLLVEMTRRGARGVHGGRSGEPARILLDGVAVGGKSVFDMPPDAVLSIEAGGGGGFGPPHERTAEEHEIDLRSGYVVRAGDHADAGPSASVSAAVPGAGPDGRRHADRAVPSQAAPSRVRRCGSPTLALAQRMNEERRMGRTALSLSTPIFPGLDLAQSISGPISGQLSHSRGEPEVRDLLRRRLNRQWPTQAEIIVTGGTKAGLLIALETIARPGDKVGILEPAWPTYEDLVTGAGLAPIRVETRLEDDYSMHREVLDKGAADASILLLCNPNNPTGRVYSRAEIDNVIDWCAERGCWLILDESFSETVYDPSFFAPREVWPYERLIVANSVSKNFCLQGLRIGTLLATKELIDDFEQVQLSILSPPSRPAQDILLQMEQAGTLAPPDLRRQRTRAWNWIRSATDWTCHQGAGSFYFFPVVPGLEQRRRRWERDGGMFILGGAHFGSSFASHFRFSYFRPLDELEVLLERLERADGTH